MKSFVTMEKHVCVVCGTEYETGAVLLDRTFKDRFDRYTVTGWGMCEKHQQMADQGFIALIEADSSSVRRDEKGESVIAANDAKRLGRVAHVKREVLEGYLGPDYLKGRDVLFCESRVIDILESAAARAQPQPQGEPHADHQGQ